MTELGDPVAVDEALADRRSALPRGTVAEVADHVEHIARVAGPHAVGLGGDFDGIDILIPGLEDVSTYPNLTAELLERGWEDDAIRALLGENVLRALAEAEAASELY